MTIESMIGSIGASVQAAHSMIEKGAVSEFFDAFFEKQEESGELQSKDAVYKPKTLKIVMPSASDTESGKTLTAPVAALVKHNNMNIDYVKINLNIGITDEKGDRLQVSSQPRKDAKADDLSGEMEIMFKCKDAPEGISRIETQMNNIL